MRRYRAYLQLPARRIHRQRILLQHCCTRPCALVPLPVASTMQLLPLITWPDASAKVILVFGVCSCIVSWKRGLSAVAVLSSTTYASSGVLLHMTLSTWFVVMLAYRIMRLLGTCLPASAAVVKPLTPSL